MCVMYSGVVVCCDVWCEVCVPSMKRIQRVTQALQGVLEDALTSGLHAQDRHTLYECLQTYAIVSRQSSAEDMYRTAVRPYMEKVCVCT